MDLNHYRTKIIQFLEEYINIIKLKISNTEFENLIDELNQNFISKSINLFNIAISNGFKIIEQDSYYYYPQTMAISLIHFTSKLSKNLQDLTSFYKLHAYFKNVYNEEAYSLRTIIDNNRLYTYIKELFSERYKGQLFNRESFIQTLENYNKDLYHLETNFLLQLFESTNLSPQEFSKKLGIYGAQNASTLLGIVKNKNRFTEPQVFRNIENFVQKFLSGRDQKSALLNLDNLKKLRGEDIRSRGITYPFRWFKDRVSSIYNNELRNFLLNYFTDIESNKYPVSYFKSITSPRASQLHLVGSRLEPIMLSTLIKFLNTLITYNKVNFYDSNYYLCKYAQDVFNDYNRRKVGKIPDHPPILNHIFFNNNNFIAMETPIWKVAKSGDVFTGHMDLLLFENHRLNIIDYKYDLEDMLRSFPQICAYGIMLNNLLNKYAWRTRNFTLKCVMFTKNEAIEFDPSILVIDILPFIQKLNSQRKEPLKAKLYPKNSASELLVDIEKLVG